MSLRIQLLGLGLLTLALPWAGYRYVQELEGALRNGLEQALLASATTIATALGDVRLGDVAAQERLPESTTYAAPLAAAPELDGYRNDWNVPDDAARPVGDAARYWTGVHERSLYVFVIHEDTSLVYQSAPTETPYGDRVVLLPRGGDADWLLLHTTAPGRVRPQRTRAPAFVPSRQYEDRALAYWRETGSGIALEVRLPLDLVGDRLGVAVIDVDPPTTGAAGSQTSAYAVAMTASWPIETQPPDPLLYRPAELAVQGRRFEQPGRRLRIVDRDGWVLFDGGALDPLERSVEETPIGLAEQILRLILARGDPPYTELERPTGYLGDAGLRAAMRGEGGVAWYARGTEASAVVAAVAPIAAANGVRGAVVLEQGSDAILTLTNEALVELMSFTLIASLLVAIGLLSYATYLSVRVRRLARAADTALSPKGDIEPKLPGRNAGDEIGDLARSFTALLRRLRDHTEYLTTLKGKLAHELRTPLAVVATSVENLEREPHGDHLRPYLARLREGSERLDSILGAMSEATALEQSVMATARERFEIDAVVRGCVEGYRDVYPERQFTYSSAAGSSTVRGSPDLVAQMLDKLVDNAVSFSASGTTVAVALEKTAQELRLSVSNRGSRLPAAMRASLFDSLVSVREPDERRGHLGLGLYVVALIAEFHGGSVSAADLPDGSGAVFTVVFPRAA